MSESLQEAYETLSTNIGQQTIPTEWFEITQQRINDFADVTMDHQWIHIDEDRAKEGPFGTTIAHGHLTLSIMSHLPRIAKETGPRVDAARSSPSTTGLIECGFPLPFRLEPGYVQTAR